MNRLAPIALAATLLAGAALPAAAQTEAAAAASAPASAAAPSGPPLKIDVNVVNPEDLLDTHRTLLIPTLYLQLLTEGRVAASKQSGFFSGGNNTAAAAASYAVEGLDKAYLQQLAQAAYDDLVAQLRGAGYTVITYADAKGREELRSAGRNTEAGPLGLPVKSEGGQQYVVVAPSDEQLFKSGFAGGAFSEFISGGKTRINDATVIIPSFVIHAPQAWTDTGSGYKRVTAEANVAPGMNLWAASAHWLGQPKSRMMRGIPGVATKAQVINATEQAGELVKVEDTTPQAANALSTVFSMFGAGNTQRSSAKYALRIDRGAYRAGVLNAVRHFNAEVAKAAAAAQP